MKIISMFSILALNALLRLVSVKFGGVSIGRGSWIKCRTEIGYGTGIGWSFTVRGGGKLVIGRYCAIGENVRVITSNHATDYLSVNYALQGRLIGQRMVAGKMDVDIGNDVWIGDQVIILPGVSIGDGAVIGTGSIVTKSIMPYTIAAGNPARTIRARFRNEVTEKLLNIEWWNWAPEEIEAKKDFFQKNLNEHGF